MLEYDNSAFYYFGLTTSIMYVLPATYITLRTLWTYLSMSTTINPTSSQHTIRNEMERQKMEELQKEKYKQVKNRVKNWKFVTHILFLILLYISIGFMAYWVSSDSEIMSFDPYKILNLEIGASDREIKKQYRKLSLENHPDKNPGNLLAEQRFMLVAKAYEALTDELAKANWEKYGNPDGRQALQLSIGLPTFLLKKENHFALLLIYFLILVIIIPSMVALWYNQSRQYGENMIMYNSYGFYNYTLNEHTVYKRMSEILAGSEEYKQVLKPLSDFTGALLLGNNAASKEENVKGKKVKKNKGNLMLQPSTTHQAELKELLITVKNDDKIGKLNYEHPIIMHGKYLLDAHVLRYPIQSKILKKQVNLMLKEATRLIDGMLSISLQKGWLQTTINIIDFHQSLIQGLHQKNSQLLQLPYFTEQIIKLNNLSNYSRDLASFLKLSSKKEKLYKSLTEKESNEIKKIMECLPNVECSATIGVEDEEEIAEGDIITIKIEIKRKQLIAEEENGEVVMRMNDPVYAPYFPYPKEERWIVIVGDLRTNSIHGFEKLTSQNAIVNGSIRLQAPSKAGNYALDIFYKCDSYLGIDQQSSLKFKVISASQLPAYVPHPEDVELDNEPTLFEQVMTGAMKKDDDDEDSDSEDEDEEEKKDK